MYYEDFEIGQTYTSPRRTVTGTDIVNFACLSGDFNAPHVDWEFCKEQPYGEPIAHGPLILAIAGGETPDEQRRQGDRHLRPGDPEPARRSGPHDEDDGHVPLPPEAVSGRERTG
jgi:hypothetical protein